MHPLLPALRRAYQLRINRFIGEIFPSGDYRGKLYGEQPSTLCHRNHIDIDLYRARLLGA
jgi:hypothetical protein